VTASSVPDPDLNNNSASTAVTPQATDLAITKTVDNSAPFVGDNVVFTVAVLNNGPDTATGAVVHDLLPSGFQFVSATGAGAYDPVTGQWAVGNFAAGASAQLQIKARVTSLAPGQNVATIQHLDQFDPVTDNDTASVSVNPREAPSADLALDKTVSDTTP